MGQGRLDTPGYFHAENMANCLKSYPIQICRASYPKIDLFNKMDLKSPTPYSTDRPREQDTVLGFGWGFKKKKTHIFENYQEKFRSSTNSTSLRNFTKKLQNHKFSSNGIKPFILIGSSKSNARLSLLF
jgi:hypothetical protein